jgi:protein-disulfide isomerase
MAIRALSAVILGAFALSGSTCGKSSTEDPSKDKGGGGGPDVPVVTLDGVDTGSLTAREKKEWSSYVSEFLSPCANTPVPVGQCVKEKRDCDRCVPGAKYIVKLVKDGMTREQVLRSYKNRFDPSQVKTVPIDGSPTKGSESAPITVVEFADFQCPHCGQYAPVIDKVVDAHKNDVRFVYKLYVLGKFPNSENAARAAYAAGKQGKFWEMHHKIFANQENLSQQGLDQMAKEVGVDVGRLHADMQLPETAERLAKDKKLGEDLAIEGTPAIYINGRKFDGGDLNEWINQELQMIGKNPPAPAASGSGSAAPAGSKADAAAPPTPKASPSASGSAPKK